jgi:transposase
MPISVPTRRPRRARRDAAVAAAIGCVGNAIFQIALAAGAPLGHAAWGGADAQAGELLAQPSLRKWPSRSLLQAPELIAKAGVGPDTAATLLITAGDNPDRLRHEKSFAALVGASPIPLNSGQIQGRFRLNRGGDRQANSALWRIAIVRMSSDQATRDYVARRESEGKTKSEAIRCLKRYIAREVYNALPKQAIAWQ